MSSMPETRYAKSGDNYVAYQVMGEGLGAPSDGGQQFRLMASTRTD
jgi:hypothetical protein